MRVIRSFGVIAMVIASLLSVVWVANAQEATPTAEPGAAQGVEYPVAVHAGTCAMPTPEPEFDLSSTIVVGSDVAEAEFIGITPGPPALAASGTIDSSLADLAATERVIALHQSADEYDTLVACGFIAGLNAEGQLVVTLQEVEMSGVSGIAFFTENEDQTDVSVYVLSPDAMPATPGA